MSEDFSQWSRIKDPYPATAGNITPITIANVTQAGITSPVTLGLTGEFNMYAYGDFGDSTSVQVQWSLTSEGSIWSASATGTSSNMWAAAIRPGTPNTYVVGGANSEIFSSADGVNWIARPSVTDLPIRVGTFAQNQFVLAGDMSTVQTSPTAAIWTRQNTAGVPAVRARGIVYAEDKNLWVICGNSGVIYTSPTAVTWTARTSGTIAQLNEVNYIDGTFYITGVGPTFLSSTDGINWSNFPINVNDNFYGLIKFKDIYILLGTSTAFYSGNLEDWIDLNLYDFGVNWHRISQGAEKAIIIGDQGILLTSSNGVDWVQEDTNTTQILNGIFSGGSEILVAANSGVTLLEDGVWNNLGTSFTQQNYQYFNRLSAGIRLRTVVTVGVELPDVTVDLR